LRIATDYGLARIAACGADRGDDHSEKLIAFVEQTSNGFLRDETAFDEHFERIHDSSVSSSTVPIFAMKSAFDLGRQASR
jgi:hypothetical protein